MKCICHETTVAPDYAIGCFEHDPNMIEQVKLANEIVDEVIAEERLAAMVEIEHLGGCWHFMREHGRCPEGPEAVKFLASLPVPAPDNSSSHHAGRSKALLMWWMTFVKETEVPPEAEKKALEFMDAVYRAGQVDKLYEGYKESKKDKPYVDFVKRLATMSHDRRNCVASDESFERDDCTCIVGDAMDVIDKANNG